MTDSEQHGIPAIAQLIEQIRAAASAQLYYLALFGALAIPDICGALGSNNGRASPSKYKDWLRKYVPEQASGAAEIYGLRCSLLHQGRAMPHGSVYPVAFTFPPGAQIHNLSTVVEGDHGGPRQVGWISIPMFIDEIASGTARWLDDVGDTQTVRRNLEKFARLRPEGLPPHVAGPLIA